MPRDLSVLVLFAEFGGLCRNFRIRGGKIKLQSSRSKGSYIFLRKSVNLLQIVIRYATINQKSGRNFYV